MRGGAGTGPGRECAALMRDLRVGDSFDMAGKRVRKARMDNGQISALIYSLKNRAVSTVKDVRQQVIMAVSSSRVSCIKSYEQQ
jgi:hypothetical protein